jgi:hypothetical protein
MSCYVFQSKPCLPEAILFYVTVYSYFGLMVIPFSIFSVNERTIFHFHILCGDAVFSFSDF